MIRSNLSILLAERGLKITKVAKETGISRTTLTALSNNYGQGIQFDTLNTLCMYLKVTPNQLLSFVPVDVHLKGCDLEIKEDRLTDSLCITEVELSDGSGEYECHMFGSVFYRLDDNEILSMDVVFDVFDVEADDIEKDPGLNKYLIYERNCLVRIFSQLSDPFLADLEEKISEMILKALLTSVELENDGYLVNAECYIKVKFSNELRGKK